MTTPLKGLKVLDFSTLLPGPYATQMMADMGAEVLRVESPSRPDIVRDLQPQIDGQSAVFHYLNRGKQSLALNLKQPQAVSIIEQLVAEMDVLVEQFRPGVMSRLGLGYEQLRSINPRLIYCSISGYGQQGDMAAKAGHDINYLARSGLASYLGREGQGPLPLSTQVADISGGAQNAVIAMLAALLQRQTTGLGQHLDISMTDSSFALNALAGPAALHSATDPVAEDHFLTGKGIYDYYQTQDQRYLAVGSLEPQFRRQLCQCLNQDGWFELPDKTLKPRLKALFVTQPLEYWQRLFADQDACVEPVLTINEAATSDLFQQRGMVIEIGDDQHRQIACPLVFSGRRPQPRSLAPRSGEHNQEILNDLGYAAGDIEILEQQGLFD
ncbi:MAG: CoA transferase [Motiliproteus sp.]|nr:CoA transferase [Motiliproteus sp.]MCW9052873.1 CoA transferase [Motiliproteus sp.]